jgi:hypothetical protein
VGRAAGAAAAVDAHVRSSKRPTRSDSRLI